MRKKLRWNENFFYLCSDNDNDNEDENPNDNENGSDET